MFYSRSRLPKSHFLPQNISKEVAAGKQAKDKEVRSLWIKFGVVCQAQFAFALPDAFVSTCFSSSTSCCLRFPHCRRRFIR